MSIIECFSAIQVVDSQDSKIGGVRGAETKGALATTLLVCKQAWRPTCPAKKASDGESFKRLWTAKSATDAQALSIVLPRICKRADSWYRVG